MTRLRSFPVAILAIFVSAGVVAAFTIPAAASNGLATASQHSGKTLPAVPTTTDVTVAPTADAPAAVPAELPDAASHGAAVAAVAQADDTTPDTNHGADVSAVALQNSGQTIAATHRPAAAGKPAVVGKPANVGKPSGAGQPADPGIPADPGAPDGAGRP
jgi:hypothetical protein